MSLADFLAADPSRCPAGYAQVQHPGLCECGDSEWSIFVAALQAAAVDGEVCQTRVRPLIRGRIKPQTIGRFYKRAKDEGLLTFIGKEPSTDTHGRNTHHDQPRYALRSAA